MAFTVIHDETLSSNGGSELWKTGISGDYTHLRICFSVRSTYNSRLDNLKIRVNSSSTTSHYKGTHLFAASGSLACFRYTTHNGINLESMPGATTSASGHFGSGEIWIMDYSNNARYKQIMIDYGMNSDSASDWYWTGGMVAGIYTQNRDPIGAVGLRLNSGSFQANTQWTIYGMTGAS